MKANYEDKIPQATSEVSLGNLYEINQQLMDKEPEINTEIKAQRMDALHDWFFEGTAKYYMLLCHDRRDYTLFNLNRQLYARDFGGLHHTCLRATEDVVECMTNRGVLLAMELQPDNVWELWIRDSEGSFVYYLFPYDDAVLEY